MDRDALAAAFNEWLRRYEQDPEGFSPPGGDDYGIACADYLLTLLRDAAIQAAERP